MLFLLKVKEMVILDLIMKALSHIVLSLYQIPKISY